MSEEQNQREEIIFEKAIEFTSAEARDAFLAVACGADEALRLKIEALIRAHEKAGNLKFLSRAKRDDEAETLVCTPSGVSESIPTSIGRYKLLQKIGEGGCGLVYMAEQQEPVRRRVALKVIKLGMDTRSVIARFEVERQALALMDHPNIAKVLDAGATEAGRPYFVMELVQGIKITDYCDQNKLSTRERLDLFLQICRAIQHAHQKGIIHRDIKPSNILVTLHDGIPIPKVIDFGIAKATTDQRLTDKTLFTAFEQFIGTPAYMSPEQASALDVDTRSDIYSLGVLLYELLTGNTPFDAKELLQVGLDEMRRTIREKEPARPSTRLSTMAAADLAAVAQHRRSDAPKLIHLLRGDLDWIVMKTLEKDRTRRYETANGLAMDVQHHLNNEPVVARPPSNVYRFQKMVRRNKLAFVATSAVAAALVFGLVFVISSIIAFRTSHIAAESLQRLVRLNVVNGVRLAKEGDPAGALLWYTEALRLDQSGKAQEDIHRIRIGSLLQQTPQLRHVWLHNQPVWFAQLSPKEDRLAIISGTEAITNRFKRAELRVWDFVTGAAVSAPMVFSGGRPQMYRIRYQAFSPDGQQIVTVQAHDTPDKKVVSQILVLDAVSGKGTLPTLEVNGLVSHVEFSPNGEFLVAAGHGGIARVWNVSQGGTLVGDFSHQSWVTIASFSPDNRYLLTGSYDKTAKLWELRDRSEPRVFQHGRFVFDAQFSHNGERIVVAASDRSGGEFRVWDVKTGTQICALDNGQGRMKGVLYQASFSPDDQQIAVANFNGTVTVWDAMTGRPVFGPFKHDHGVLTSVFAPDGHRILSASFDSTARLWTTLSDHAQLAALNHCSFTLGASFTRDGQQVVTTSTDGMVRAWRLPRVPGLITMTHGGEVLHAEFSHDGRRVLTTSVDHTARVWDSQTGQLLFPPLAQEGAVYQGTFSLNDQLIVTASADGTARIWDATTGKQIGPALRHSNTVWHAEFDLEGKRVVTASGKFRRLAAASSSLLRDFSGPGTPQAEGNDEARVWEVATGRPLTPPLAHTDAVVYAGFSPDGNQIITTSADRTAQLWQLPQGTKTGTPMLHKGIVFRASFSPNRKWIATVTGGEGNLVKGAAELWKANTGEPVGRAFEHGDIVYSATFSRDGRRLVTASEDGTARVWDVNSGEAVSASIINGSIVLGASFSPDDRFILTSSLDGMTRIWDAANGELLAQMQLHTKQLNASAFSPDGKRILTASDDGTAKITVLPYTNSKLADLVLLAQVFSARRIVSQGTEVEPLSEQQFEKSWTLLCKRFPDRFGLSRPQN